MHSAQRSNVGSGNYERGSGAGRVAIYFIWLIMLLSLFCVGRRAEAADQTIFGPVKYELQKGKQTVYTDRFGDGSNSTKAHLRVQNGNDPRTSIKHVRVYINDRQVLSRKDFRRKKQSIEKEISIKGSNSIKVVLKRGCRSYWRLLGEYEARDERTNKELERLALLKKEIENLIAALKKSGDISSSRLEALSRQIDNLAGHSEGRQGHFAGIGRSLDDDFDGDDDFDNDDDDDIREPGRERITHERELLERYGREIHDFHGLCNDLGNRFHGKDTKVKKLLPQLMSQLKELEERIEKEIKILAEIEEKLEALRKRGAPFITVEIHKQGSSDVTPPTISLPQPTDGALLAHARPAISAVYADNSGGSGIDPATVKVSLDSSDITPACAVTPSGVSCAPTSNLVDGAHSVTVSVSDIAKNPASYSWRFTTDTTPPRATVTSPQSGQNLGNAGVTVTGAVDDPAATITVNGTAATLTGLTYSVADVPLTEGVNTIAVIARDPAGNQSATSINVTLDTSLPVVTITAPIDGSFTSIPTITVSGQVNETPAAVTINGRAATLTGSTFVLENMPLAEGQNSITALATDLAGNKGTAVATVTLDTANPQIFVTAPANGLLTRNPQLTITGMVSEPLTSLTANTKPVTLNGLAFETALTLNEGVNTITLEGLDRAGNKGAATITVTLDSTPPVAPVLEALPVVTNNPSVTLRGSAEAGSSVVLYVGDVSSGQTVADQSGLFTFANITLTEGTNIFTAASLDQAGNTSRISETIGTTLDTKAPVVTITIPLDKVIVNTPAITVSGTIDDPSAQVTVNGLPAINSGGIWTLEGVTLQEGINTLLVEARDPAGNKGSASVTVVLDTVPPTVTITAPVDGMYTNIVQVTVTGKTNEEVASVTVNGITATISTTSPANSTFTAPLTLTEGANSITVTAIDKAGNTGSATVTVILDTIAPQLTVIGPADGALLNNGQITFGGSAAEPVVSVLINGIVAQAGTNGGYTLPLTLAEGNNNLTVTAIDRAGNSSTSAIAVTLDSTPPAAPLLNQIATPTRTATTTLSGQAEANSTVKLFNNGVLIATLKADAAGQFSTAEVTLTEGINPFTAQATDAAGNTSPLSAPLTVVLDTKPPVITVTAPQPGMVISAAQVTITGTVDEPLASLTINGGAATLNGNTFEYVMTLAAGDNSALITATDLAGNVATTTVTIQRDSTPPKVVIVAPLSGLLTNNPQIQVSGTVDDAEATLTLLGAPISVTNKAFTVGYLLIDGDNSIQVKAIDKAGNEGTSTVTVILDAQAPVVTLTAPATAVAGANISITINATDNRNLTLAELRANGVPIWSASPTNSASVTETIGYRLAPDLNAGAEVTLQARVLDAAGNEGIATAKIIISQAAAGPGYVQGKVLDDIRGLRMEGATVIVTDSKSATKTATSGSDGGYFFEIPSGEALVKITRPGYTAVERRLAVRPEQKATVLDARLTKANDTKGLVDATGGVVKSTPFKSQNSSVTIDVSIPANALAAEGDLRITPVSNQGLIGTLPLGWSPLAVADVRLLDPATGAPINGTSLATAATARFTMPVIANLATATLALARYDETDHQWRAAGSATPATDGLSATADILTSGQYAVVIADPAPNAPQAAQPGQPLAAAALQSLDFSLTTATGKVIPQAAPPSAGLKAAGEVVVTAKADAAQQPVFTSGLLLGGRITEKFDLLSGDKVEPVSYTQDIVLYRQPCITNIGAGAVSPLAVSGAELRTTFPVSPSKDYTIVDLLLGKVGIEILPPDTTESGVMVGADGGRIVDADGNILLIPQGALNQTTPVSTKNVAASAAIGDDFTLLKTVEVNFTRQILTTSASLSIPAPTGLDANLPLVIAKGVTVKGVNKLKLVALAKQNGSFITSVPLAPELTNSSNSINSSGTYYFLQAKGQIGFITGTITDASGNPFAGALVKSDSGSLIDLAENSGKYLLAAPVASFNATATDLYKGDEVTAAGVITAANQAVTLNLVIRMIPPRVTAITPANGAINVQPTVSVVVTFSKPMDKNSITLKLTDSAGTAISGVLTFSVDNTAVTFYPSDAFKQETKYTVTIASTVKDVQGYSLGQDVVSNFTVRKTTPPVMPPAGAISGTFPDADGFITVTATQGSAPADCTVLLINDTSGEIQSVTPQSNGSFTGKVRGQLGDEIKVVLMDYSGNQTTISYLTFKNSDGSYLVTAKGGKIEGEGGSILDIPEGALVGPAVIKITTLQESNLPTPLQAPGKYLGAVNIDTGGIAFQKAVEISIPIPAGFNTNDAVFITKPGTLVNSDDTTEQVYEIIDSTKIVGNRITSACDPFPGVWAGGSLVFTDFPELTPIVVSGYTYQDRNDLPSFQPAPEGVVETPTKDAVGNLVYKYDRPIQGAVIRSPDAWNYVSYTNSKGFYGTFASMAVLPAGFAGPDANCKRYRIAAVNPQTMFKSNFDGYACAPPYNVRDVNFKLADKDTIPPDRTAPVISMSLSPVSGSIVAGTTTVGVKLKLPLSIIDQAMKSATLTVNYSELGSGPGSTTSFVLKPPASPVLHAFLKAEQANVYRYDYTAQFNPDAALNYYTPELPGYYTFKVEAHDAAAPENVSIRTLQLHVVASGVSLGTPVDGPPRVDAIFPENDSKDIMVTTQIVATFNEPVQGVDTNFKLYDMETPATPVLVPASVIVGIEGGRMQATLIPKGNLFYARNYKIVLSVGIKDTAINPSSPNQPPAGDGLLNMENDFISYFTTKVPNAYDLTTDQQFTGGRDIDLYTFEDIASETDTYAYVAAGDKGWRIVDVTDPTVPETIFKASSTCASNATSDCRYVGPEFNFRSVAVHPDKDKSLMAMTENITFADGNQYGYVRFYDLSSEPGNPPVIGREKLAEAYSGIPGRLAMWGDYAVVSTAVAGIQIVNIKQAIKNQTNGQPSDGSSIAGVLDTMGQDYGSPNDLAIFNERSAVFTTNPGYLLTVDLNLPTDQQSVDDNMPFLPVVINAYKPAGYSFTRIGVATGFPYTDANGIEQTINLAVSGTTQGKVVTLDVTDPISPTIIGTATQADGITPATAIVRDITVSKDAGLAFITTYNAIQVYDIKDPTKPRLLNEITQLPDSSGVTNPNGTPVMVPIGETPAIIEKGGWVYLANMTKGMRTLDLDPVTLTLETNSIKLDTPMKGKALNDEVYFSYTVKPQTKEGFDPATAVLTVMESGKTIKEIQNIPYTTGKHVIQFKAKELGFTFDVEKRYTVKIAFAEKTKNGTIPNEKVARIPLEWQAIATDYNRDGKIDQYDLDYAATGNIDRIAKTDPNMPNGVTGEFAETTNKHYFWINDNADVSDTEGNSIPGSGSDFVNPKGGSNQNPQTLKDYLKPKIAGTRDLVDYFPVLLNIGDIIQKLIPDKYMYIIKQGQSAVNYLPTDMLSGEIRSYLTNVTTATTLVDNATKTQVKDNGTKLDATLLQKLIADGEEQVVLVEGMAKTRKPLILEVKDKANGEIAFKTELPLSIDRVEQMFRHVNLTQSINADNAPAVESSDVIGKNKAKGGEKNRLNSPPNLPDNETDEKYFVMLHGFNNDGQVARGWHSEMFKRLYWSGSHARFVGVSWYGYEDMPNYQQNVVNAFKTAAQFGQNIVKATNNAPVTILAHSLGNIVVSSYLSDYHLALPDVQRPNIVNYFMLNAAVPLEAYLGDYKQYAEGKLNEPFGALDTENPMVHQDWHGYQKRLATSEWYQLFGTGDQRRTLTWRNRFKDLPANINYYSFFSTGEDVLATHIGTPWLLQAVSNALWNGSRYSWAYQEKWKGRGLSDGLGATTTMGWGFNTTDTAYNPPNSPDITTAYGNLNEATANSTVSDDMIRTNPFFNKTIPVGVPTTLFDEGFSVDLKQNFGRDRLLAKALPALTTPVGGWMGEDIKARIGSIVNMNIPLNKNDWPDSRKNDGDLDWRHSDIKNVAYPFVYKIFNMITQ